LTNADTFWDDVKRFTKNLHSDRAIRSWEWLSEKRYNELCGIEDVNESLKRNSVKENSMKLKINENGNGSMTFEEFRNKIMQTYNDKFPNSLCSVRLVKVLGRAIVIDCFLAKDKTELINSYWGK